MINTQNNLKKCLNTCLFVFGASVCFGSYAAVVKLEDVSILGESQGELIPFDFLGESSGQGSKDLQDLSDKEKYAVMLTALQTGEIKGAIALAQSVAKKPAFTGDVQIRVVLVIAKILGGELVSTRQELSDLTGKDQYERASILLAKAIAAIHSKDYGQAQIHLGELMKLNPKHAYALVLNAHTHMERGNFEGAHRALEQALALNPRMRIALNSAGHLAMREAKYGDAIVYFDRILDQKGLACTARNGKAGALIAIGRLQEVGALLKPCTKITESLLLDVAADVQLGLLDQAWGKLTKEITSENRHQLSLPAARIALKRGDLASVFKYTDVNDVDHLFLNSVARIANGEYSTAKSQLQQILKQNDKSDIARILISASQIALGEDVAGLDSIARESVFYPLAALLKALNEQSAIKAEQYLRAAGGLGEALSFDGVSSSEVTKLLQDADKENLVLGNLFYLLDSSPLATKHFLISAQKGGDFISSYMLGVLDNKANRLLEAEKNAKASLQQAPNLFPAQILLADTSLRQGKLEQALASYERSLTLRPEAFVAIKAGMIAERLQLQQKAEQHYRTAVALQPKNFMTYNQLAWYLGSQNKNMQEAIGLAQKALELAPGSANILDTLGWLYYLSGSSDKAKTTLERAMTASADVSPSVLYHLGMVEKSLNNTARAAELFERVVNGERPSKYTEDAKQQLLSLKK